MRSASARLPMPASVNSNSTLSGVDKETCLKNRMNFIGVEMLTLQVRHDRAIANRTLHADCGGRNKSLL